MTSETDAEFVEWVVGRIVPGNHVDHFTASMTPAQWMRLTALARRGTAVPWTAIKMLVDQYPRNGDEL